MLGIQWDKGTQASHPLPPSPPAKPSEQPVTDGSALSECCDLSSSP